MTRMLPRFHFHARATRRSGLLAASLLLAAPLASCQKDTPAAAAPPALSSLPAYDPAASLHQEFSGQKALDHALAVVAFGPRPSGSEALEKTRQYFETELKKTGWVTERQTFEDTTPRGRKSFTNVRARFPGGGDPWKRPVPLLIASHYDTKVFDDAVFVGANDGGSGNGAMLEIARVLAQKPAVAQRVELVFFDGEEAIVNFTPLDGLHGSRHYARWLRGLPRELRPSKGIVLDMVGEKALNIGIPPNSSSALRQLVFRAAEDAGHRRYFSAYPVEILDDHVPLQMAGVEMTNLIDMDFKAWHTPDDTADQLSAESLGITGQTTVLLVEKYLLR